MATAERTMVVDGQLYNEGDEIPDIGSWVAVSVDGNIRHYNGLSADVSKLPKYVNTGSSALALDTGNRYKFYKPTKTWYKISSGTGTSTDTEETDYTALVDTAVVGVATVG